MLTAIINWITGNLVGQLTAAYKAKLAAANETERLIADAAIKHLETTLEERRVAASVVKAGMQHKAFWIPWLLAALPLSAWFAWGVADSMLNGALPDVATLPPQLKEYADIVWGNIFYVGGGVAGLGVIASAIKGRK
ncbi:hypothetical protein [Allomesorhizobium camelthorni]|uniref:hypothetical protein n=1 Tax=Allomesorhizobium camelthorni TaxID=475069 RepID=UPI0019803558|nr:hypothetical protein [Mesorhizobium camelthorni]